MNIEYGTAFAAVDSPVLRLGRAVDCLSLLIKPWLLDSYYIGFAAVVEGN
jgi:hypothetical protein